MTTYGLTSTGFVSKPLLTAQTEIIDALKTVFGTSIDTSAQSVFGQLAGIMAERESDIWDALQELDASFDPDSATGDALDALCALTGITRLAATHSTVDLYMSGDNGTVIPAGSQVSQSTTGVKWETLAAGTISAGSCTIAAQAVETGPLVAAIDSIDTIETPVSGWTSVTNTAEATAGRDAETDADLRARRETELHRASNAAVEAIKTALLDVDGVTAAVVFENVTDVTDGDGLLPHSIKCVVDGTATSANIAHAIFDAKAAGIATNGTTTTTVTDSMGVTHAIKHTAASEIDIWISIAITYDADHWPSTGLTDVRADVLAYGDTLEMGKNVVAAAISAQVFATEGVLDATVLIGTSNPPVASTTIPIAITERAVFDTARLAITAVAGTP